MPKLRWREFSVSYISFFIDRCFAGLALQMSACFVPANRGTWGMTTANRGTWGMTTDGSARAKGKRDEKFCDDVGNDIGARQRDLKPHFNCSLAFIFT
jgi:hypothetical protein